MSDEKLPIKFFATRDIDELRVEGGGGNEPPKWLLSGAELVERAQQLSGDLNRFAPAIAQREETDSIVPFVFVAKMHDDATSKSRRHDIAELFRAKDRSNVIGLCRSDELIVRMDSLTQMKMVSARLEDYGRNKAAISCLEHFGKYEPLVIEEKGKQSYKVKLMDFQDYEQNLAVQRLFEKTATEKGIAFKKTNYTERVSIYSFKGVDKAVLDAIKESEVFEALFSIEPMPKYKLSLDMLGDTQTVGIMKPKEDQHYATIGILDSGIAPIPHLAPWLTGKRWSVYPENVINPSHGTFVSGVALYGDSLEEQNWVGHKGVRLFDAAVFPDTYKEGIDESELIENIKEAVKQNHEKVKIWNLSISVTNPVQDDSFSDFALALDDLQDEYNVLICKSAGNCNNFLLGKPKGRIHEGADSIRSLVVGSIAHKRERYDLAAVDNPSPFSRIGPGPEYIIKPEVAHYGGNAGVDLEGKARTTGVKSFYQDGSIASAVGTSFSTPRITSLAAGVYQELNEAFDPLLIKALIIHSASYSENLELPTEERTKQLGFGRPKTVNEIIYNSPHEATLILRDKLPRGEKIDVMDFPMPNGLVKDGFYTGQIVATLVYDPVLDASQGAEYCQSNIDVKFGSYDGKIERDLSKRNILNPVGQKNAQNVLLSAVYSTRTMKAARGDFALRERILIQYGDKYYPVKKYAVDLSELTDGNRVRFLTQDKHWFLYLKGLYRDHVERKANLNSIELGQEFCLILTIRDPLGKAAVYNEVSQKLDEYNFWHSNIKIGSKVNIPVPRAL
ncbi:Peptidase S8/S53 domain protein [Acididesulfobacillus acetoxydans]|uniref:Peptidase S8/S53 domain protein n=1 Tax=Acididesulfobacillus acetoxydans TaxID=1561005 RepID=A0A8S0XA87_9FIRM|nr:S8 family peptidase [Acididesulfobacillus acetoxydans]CAA7599576.1 Peptidase S8/S53 domain protein [Acididesulfobacillus acetoxydans]CEJ07771.1 Peptidase families S8 and S53 [Acididesulfobacillus acetoxydans]